MREGRGEAVSGEWSVERAPGDPRELLRLWMLWEEGETTPGKLISELKTKGLRELLEHLVAQLEKPPSSEG